MIFSKYDKRHNGIGLALQKNIEEHKIMLILIDKLNRLAESVREYEKHALDEDDNSEPETWTQLYRNVVTDMAEVYIYMEVYQWLFANNINDKIEMDDEIMAVIDKTY